MIQSQSCQGKDFENPCEHELISFPKQNSLMVATEEGGLEERSMGHKEELQLTEKDRLVLGEEMNNKTGEETLGVQQITGKTEKMGWPTR